METCIKCGEEIAYNEATQLWEDESVIICRLGPYPWKHSPPFSARLPDPVVVEQVPDSSLWAGYGFFPV